MPCVDGREDLVRMENIQRRKEMKKRLDAATRAACEMSKLLSEHTLKTALSKESFFWIMQHRAEDAHREAGPVKNCERDYNTDKVT